MASPAISTRRLNSACQSRSRQRFASSTRASAKRGPANGSATKEDVEDEREQDAQDQAGEDRKVVVDAAAVGHDLLDSPAVLAVGPCVNDDFHSPLASDLSSGSPSADR